MLCGQMFSRYITTAAFNHRLQLRGYGKPGAVPANGYQVRMSMCIMYLYKSVNLSWISFGYDCFFLWIWV